MTRQYASEDLKDDTDYYAYERKKRHKSRSQSQSRSLSMSTFLIIIIIYYIYLISNSSQIFLVYYFSFPVPNIYIHKLSSLWEHPLLFITALFSLVLAVFQDFSTIFVRFNLCSYYQAIIQRIIAFINV